MSLGTATFAATSTSEASKKADPSRDVIAIVEKAAKKDDFSKELEEISKKDDRVVPVLISIYQDGSKDWQQRWFCAIALTKFPQEKSREALVKGSKDPISNIRAASIQALGWFEDEESLTAIKKGLDDSSLMVRDTAVRALGKRKDRNAVEALGKELFDKHNFYRGQPLFNIRENVVIALGDIGSMKGIEPLMKIFKQEPNSNLQPLACKSLEKIVKPEVDTSKKGSSLACPDYWLAWQKQNKEEVMRGDGRAK